jgi:4-hydroxythreonine-4-phosphate dehydrogenase
MLVSMADHSPAHDPHDRAAPPVVLLTCGDPAGIGPEIVAAAWAAAAHDRARFRVVADAGMLAEVLTRRGGAPPPVVVVSGDDPRPSAAGQLLVIEPPGSRLAPDAVPDATISAAGGEAAARAVKWAASAVRSGQAAAIVTGPLHKEALHAAGYDVPGHTELLARACGLPDEAASMMLWLPARDGSAGGLGVVHATLHESLRTALDRLSADRIAAAGRRLHHGLSALLGRPPRIAVAALNPHGGEGGLFGDEEARLVAPAVGRLVAAGLAATGPLPADTLFVRAAAGEFDGVVALYHDQGHIPIKLLGMHRAVNITLGLPLVRTSVAHGTAFDIVGRGKADATGMLAAIDAAIRLAAAPGFRAASAPAS